MSTTISGVRPGLSPAASDQQRLRTRRPTLAQTRLATFYFTEIFNERPAAGLRAAVASESQRWLLLSSGGQLEPAWTAQGISAVSSCVEIPLLETSTRLLILSPSWFSVGACSKYAVMFRRKKMVGGEQVINDEFHGKFLHFPICFRFVLHRTGWIKQEIEMKRQSLYRV